MKKRRIIFWIFVFSVVGSAIVLFSLSLPQRVVVPNQLKNDIPVGEIYGKTTIGQTFVAQYNNLMAIEVLLATYNRKNTGNFLFHLKRGEEDLFTYKGNLSKVKDNAYFRFAFSKIGASKGEKFYFFIEAPLSPGMV